MAAPIYSTRFLALPDGTLTVVTYTVPAGCVAIVKDVTVYQAATIDTTLLVNVDSPFLVLYYGGTPGTPSGASTRSMGVVLNAGETLQAARTNVSQASVAVSGYLLSS